MRQIHWASARLLGLAFLLMTGQASARADQGDLVAHELIRTQTRKSLDLSKKVVVPGELPPSLYAIELHHIRYRTIALDGSPTIASGLVVLPSPGESGVRHPLLSYHHGTSLFRADVPSSAALNVDAWVASAVFGSMGYVVAAADYLGLGDSPGPHPYLHAKSEASATADMLLATRQLCEKFHIGLDGSLFLTGYSQGGHVTLALHRHLEENGIQVSASAPMGGPYDLSWTSLRGALLHPSSLSTFYAAYLLMSLRLAHPHASSLGLGTILRAPYAELVPKLFTGEVPMGKVIDALPGDPKEFFTVSFVSGVLESADHPFRKLLAENDVYDWRPKAPVLFVHARGDRHVPYENAEVALRRMRELGGNARLVDIGDYDHVPGALPALLRAYRWFESVRTHSGEALPIML